MQRIFLCEVEKKQQKKEKKKRYTITQHTLHNSIGTTYSAPPHPFSVRCAALGLHDDEGARREMESAVNGWISVRFLTPRDLHAQQISSQMRAGG